MGEISLVQGAEGSQTPVCKACHLSTKSERGRKIFHPLPHVQTTFFRWTRRDERTFTVEFYQQLGVRRFFLNSIPKMDSKVSSLRYSRCNRDTALTKVDMIAVLSYRPLEHADMRERIIPHFAAYSAANVSFGNAWRNMVMEPPRRELRNLLRLGIKRGELLPKLDIELSLALLLGPGLYWYIFLRRTLENPKALAEGVVDAFWSGFGLQKSSSKPSLRRLKSH